ncbi:MAG: ABC transporter permease [Actinomycetota bacterium]
MAAPTSPGAPGRPTLADQVTPTACPLRLNSGTRRLHYALTHPALAGVTWDAEVTPNPTGYTARGFTDQFIAEVRAAAGSGARLAVADRFVVSLNGVGVPAVDLQAPDGSPSSISLAVTAGQPPVTANQADIGPETARELGVHVGDTVSLGALSMRIVGEALFPSDPHSEFDEGIWLTPATFNQVVPPLGGGVSSGNIDRVMAVTAPPEGSAAALLNRLNRSIGNDVSDIQAPQVPPELSNLHYIRTLPTALASFVALVAIAAVSLALVASTRRRRQEFAVLRALGLAPSGARMVLNAQGTAIGIFGLLVGIPLGLAVGRVGWRLVAGHVPLQVSTPLAWIGFLLLIPATVIVVNLLPVLPGRTVARRAFPVRALRAE